jgi:hypothetical protein
MGHWDLVVVGAGAAGLVAAARAAERGHKVLLLEKNRKPGAKILMSGGTRCNLTHATDARGIVEAFGPPGRFLFSALHRLGPQGVVDLFESEGVRTKVEPAGKVFPASDRALDVLGALLARLKRSGAELAPAQPLHALERTGDGFRLVTSRGTLSASKVILTPGGRSYPGCGTAGDGYGWAAGLGHTIVPPRPALVPFRTDAPWVPPLKGVTMSDVFVRVVERPVGDLAKSRSERRAAKGRAGVLAECRGSFLFTHFGLSGPAVLNVSRAASACERPEHLVVECDFLPGMPAAELDAQIIRESTAAGKRQMASLVARWLPHRLAETLARRAGVDPEGRAAQLGKADRARLVGAIKHLAVPITGTLGFKKAEVTAGGVALDEVDSRTMQSRLVPGLYVAGELLDLDGPIGGYNFQAAFSTGFLAGDSA